MKLKDVLGMKVVDKETTIKTDTMVNNEEKDKNEKCKEKTDVTITPKKIAKGSFRRYQKEVIEFSEKNGLRMREMCVLEHLLKYADGPSVEKKEMLREAMLFLFEEY